MNFPMLLDAGISGRLCLTLLHSLWQVVLLVVVAWVIDRVARKSSVERGYALHVAALFLALVALPVTYALLPAPVATPIDVATMPVDEFLLPEVSLEPIAAAPLEELPQPPVMIEPPVIVINSESAAATSEPEPTSPGWMTAAPWIVAFYALGVALMLLRLAVGSAKAHALCRRAKPIVDGPLASLLARLVREWSLGVRCRLAESAEVVVPQVIGLVRPTILLPAAAITGLAPRDLEMILVHELAHIRRHDVWVNFVQRLAEAILFFNPGLWYLSRRIGTLREYCCDELACRDMPGDTLPPRVEYATALLNVVELAKPGARKVELGALAASGRGPSELRRRVARLFGEPLREPLRLSRGGVLAAVGMAVVLLVGPAWWASSAQEPADGDSATSEESADEEMVVVRGRVVDENGRPVPGAKVSVVRARGNEPLFTVTGRTIGYVQQRLSEVDTNEQGEFKVEVPRYEQGDESWTYGDPRLLWKAADLVAAAPGYALDWVASDDGPYDRDVKLTLKSRPSTIKGRLVDAEGAPVEGASVSLAMLARGSAERVAQWVREFDDMRAGKVPPPDESQRDKFHLNFGTPIAGVPLPQRSASLSPIHYPGEERLRGATAAFPTRVKTDAQGRFELAGLPADQLAVLQIEGQGIQLQQLQVVTRQFSKIPIMDSHLYGEEFEHVVRPGLTIRGLVTDEETGEPLEGFTVTSTHEVANYGMEGPLAETTDSEGRFVLSGLSLRGREWLTMVPAQREPYLVSELIEVPEIPDASQATAIDMIIPLRRGVLVTGRLTDEKTGEPVEGTIHVHPLRDNPHAKNYSALDANRSSAPRFDGTNKTAPDGSFTTVVIPGKSIVGVLPLEMGRYSVGLGADEIAYPRQPGGLLPTYGHCSTSWYSRLVELDVPPDSGPIERDLTVSSGETVKLKPVDGQGKPLAEVRAFNVNSFSGLRVLEPGTETIDIIALKPNEDRPVILLHQPSRLAKIVPLSAQDSEDSPRSVTLEPCGSVVARLVDGEGKPLSKAGITAALLPLRLSAAVETGVGDEEGKVELKYLPPGGTYQVVAGHADHGAIVLADGLEVKAGERIDLGTVDVTEPDRPEPLRIDFEIEDPQGSNSPTNNPVLSGRVVDEQEKPLPGVKVVLYGGADTRFREQETLTDDEGQYDFDPLTSGLVSRSRGEPTARLVGVVFEHETHVPADGISWRDITITLEEGKETVETLDLKMVPGGRVSGIVRHAETGEPMPKLSLRLYNGLPGEKGATYHEYAATDENGQFATAAVFPGRYVIDINDNDFEGDRKYPKIGLVEVKAGETAIVELTTRNQPQLQDPFTITGTGQLEDGTLVPHGLVGVRLVGSENKSRSNGGWITSRHGFSLSFGPVERGEVSENSPYGVGTHDIEIYGDSQRDGYRLVGRTPSEPLRITDDPTKPELENGIRYIRPGVPVEFELVFEKIPAVTIIGDKFVVCPVTTPLERSLVGNIGRPEDVTTCLLVNNATFSADAPIDPQGDEWQQLAERLKATQPKPNAGLYVRLIDLMGGDLPFERRRERHERLEKVIEKLARQIGFAGVHTSHYYGNGRRNNWRNTIEEAQRKVKEDASGGLPLVDTDKVRVSRVSTFLSHMLVDADCVVDWLPVVRDADGARLMADVLPAVAEAVNEARTEGGDTLLIRLRFSETEKSSLEKWVNDIPARKFYAGGLGFELCNVSQTQIAKEEEQEAATKPAVAALAKSPELDLDKARLEISAMFRREAAERSLLMAEAELATARGEEAEADGDHQAALKHYRQALEFRQKSVAAHDRSRKKGMITQEVANKASMQLALATVAVAEAEILVEKEARNAPAQPAKTSSPTASDDSAEQLDGEATRETVALDSDQIAVLEELVESYQQIYEAIKVRHEAKTRGGSADRLYSAELALVTAKAELETAKGNLTAAVDHYKAAVEAADQNVAAHQKAYEVGTITLDAVLDANRKRAEAKLALSRAGKALTEGITASNNEQQ